MVGRGKHDIYILTDMHNSPANGNFCDGHENAAKSRIIQDYSQHLKYNAEEEQKVNSYLIKFQRW
jgi:prepilin-type processing-associated H-X9-DG protein